MGKSLMILGCASSVGKSVITAGLCRVFARRGVNVSPFKSQNMALNSYITSDGKEMGRAQVVQAEAAMKEPHVNMNPILIKPSSDVDSQVVVKGRILENMNAAEYHEFKPKLRLIVEECYKELENNSDLVLLEGAGSPAEINLREGDLVNMGMAEISDSPAILIGDIDKGGVFASLYGTVMLLAPEERARIKGLVVNKFRGDVKLLEPGLKMLEDKINIPFLGVIPWHNIDIEDEDSLSDRFTNQKSKGSINISVLRIPHISNYTDFTLLEALDEVNLRYVMPGELVGDCDVVVIPGSKSVVSDFLVLKSSGWDREIYRLKREGRVIVGICGGYQMLGKLINDPHGVEGNCESINGLGLLDMETTFQRQKQTTRSSGFIGEISGEWSVLSGHKINGYEIHMGVTESKENPLINIEGNGFDGGINGNVIGTYFHGIFDNRDFTSAFLNKIKSLKGIDHNNEKIMDFNEYKDCEFNKLADLLEASLDIDAIEGIIKNW